MLCSLARSFSFSLYTLVMVLGAAGAEKVSQISVRTVVADQREHAHAEANRNRRAERHTAHLAGRGDSLARAVGAVRDEVC